MKKQQHTVSEFYLRGFAVPAPTKGDADGFWVYRRGQGSLIFSRPKPPPSVRTSIATVTSKAKRRTDIEDALGRFEGEAAPDARGTFGIRGVHPGRCGRARLTSGPGGTSRGLRPSKVSGCGPTAVVRT